MVGDLGLAILATPRRQKLTLLTKKARRLLMRLSQRLAMLQIGCNRCLFGGVYISTGRIVPCLN
jgi:hypothetical protein